MLWMLQLCGWARYSRPGSQSPPQQTIVALTLPNSRHDLEPLRAAVRKAGYTGRVVIHLGISREGTPEHVRVASPAFLANAAEVMSAIGTWRFRPGIRAGKQAAMPMEFNIDVSGPRPVASLMAKVIASNFAIGLVDQAVR